MHEVRVLFNAIMEEVIRDGDNCSLSRPEKLALEKLKIDRTTNPSPKKDMSFAERALKRKRKSIKMYPSFCQPLMLLKDCSALLNSFFLT